MSPKDNQQNGFSQTEKKVLLGETTFVSVGIVILLVSVTVYVVTIGGRIEAQAKVNERIQNQVDTIQTNYKDQTKDYTATLIEISSRLGRIEGKLQIDSKQGK